MVLLIHHGRDDKTYLRIISWFDPRHVRDDKTYLRIISWFDPVHRWICR